jgi:hypothetical protein
MFTIPWISFNEKNMQNFSFFSCAYVPFLVKSIIKSVTKGLEINPVCENDF